MLKNWTGLVAIASLVTACALPPQPDPNSVKIEGTPGSAVIYVVRTKPDLAPIPAQIAVNDQTVGVSYPGVYYRVEAPAGRVRLSGTGADGGAMTLDTQAGGIYFVQHTVSGSWRVVSPYSFFSVMDERRARVAMAAGERG